MRESFALGCGMNARGSTEVIVATIGLSMGALSQNLFTIIVTMAVLTTMAMPPMLRSALAKLPLRKAEKERLEREEIEAKGFVPKLERLLLAVDDSPNAQFATRLATMVAGSKGMPTTVIQLHKGNGKSEQKAAAEPEAPEKPVAAEPKAAGTVITKVAPPKKPPELVVAEEASKGYDIMVVGMERTIARGRNIHADVTRIAGQFNGSLAIVDGRNGHLEDPRNAELSILVPLNGTTTARNAAEIAFVIAHASDAPVTILYVGARTSAAGRKRRRGIRARRPEQAILKDITALAEGYGVKWRTAVLADISADQAILKQSERDRHNLIVMGASRRPGENLFFGETAATVLEKSKASLVIVSTGGAL
jgi:nucleotide-binding universal stress UspA family protein